MQTRRKFIQQVSSLLGIMVLKPSTVLANSDIELAWFMPDEAETHACTWMAFGANKRIWGAKLLPEVQHNLASIANTIAKYEPVRMLANPQDLALAKKLLGANTKVELVACPVDDLWIRDSGAVFVLTENGKKAAIDFNFNGWGNKQTHVADAKVANLMCKQAKVERIVSELVLEGGGIEVDGHGTAIITESCVINKNRNPNMSKQDCEGELKALLGLDKIIWLPGIKGKDITDGHTDFYARFVKPGVVVAAYDADPESFDHAVTKRHLDILRTATDAQGRKLEVVVLESPRMVRPQFDGKDFAAGYINFYVCNGAVIAPQFGDKQADLAAKNSLQTLFPRHTIELLNIDGIAAGGGGIHCATQQEPAI